MLKLSLQVAAQPPGPCPASVRQQNPLAICAPWIIRRRWKHSMFAWLATEDPWAPKLCTLTVRSNNGICASLTGPIDSTKKFDVRLTDVTFLFIFSNVFKPCGLFSRRISTIFILSFSSANTVYTRVWSKGEKRYLPSSVSSLGNIMPWRRALAPWLSTSMASYPSKFLFGIRFPATNSGGKGS